MWSQSPGYLSVRWMAQLEALSFIFLPLEIAMSGPWVSHSNLVGFSQDFRIESVVRCRNSTFVEVESLVLVGNSRDWVASSGFKEVS